MTSQRIQDGIEAITDPRARVAVTLEAYQYTQTEIAELLSSNGYDDTTPATVRGILSRHRARRPHAEGDRDA